MHLKFAQGRVYVEDFFYFDADLPGRVEDGRIIVADRDKKALGRVVSRGLTKLKSKLGRDAVYIDEKSGIPLIGSQYFGLIDRGTNIIEIRPMTGCNLNCIYCAVDEGAGGKKTTDYLVEPSYILKWFEMLAAHKAIDDIEAHINPQGEPLLYRPLPELIRGLKAIRGVKTVSIDTNGTLLNEKTLRELEAAGLDRLNISINAFSQDRADMIAGCRYDVKKVLEVLKKARIEVLLAPLLIPGYNEEEIRPIVRYCIENGYRIGVQSYLYYRGGRNPARPMEIEDFFGYLKGLEKELGTRLIADAQTFKVHRAKSLEKPFRKGQVVKAKVACPGRHVNECIAVSHDRCIQVSNCRGKAVTAKIVRTKHNIFLGR